MVIFQYPKQFSIELNSLLSNFGGLGMMKLEKCIELVDRNHANQSSRVA